MPTCEVCDTECEWRTGCPLCGKLVCDQCLVAPPDDDGEDVEVEMVCQECF